MKKNILIPAAAILLSVSGTAFAKDSTALTTTNTAAGMETTRRAAYSSMQSELTQQQADRAELKKKKEEMIAQRCSTVQERIATRIENFGDNKDKHMAVYGNMTARISKFIDNLSGQGYDVSKVKADLDVLKGKIEKFSADKDARLAKLDETKEFACGKSDGEFKAKLKDARAALQLVHADAMDIRSYMLGTVRPDIQALRAQKADAKTSATDGGSAAAGTSAAKQ